MPRGFFVPPTRLVRRDCVLRSFLPGDGPRLHRALSTSAAHLTTFTPTWVESDLDPLRAEEFARNACARYLRNEQFTWAVLTPDEQVLIGTCTLAPHESGPAEIGGWTTAVLARDGWASRVGREAIRWIFTDWPYDALCCRCEPGNQAGLSLAAAIGMRDPEPSADGRVELGLTRTAWLRAQPAAVAEEAQVRRMLLAWSREQRLR